jgi:ComF family protein
VSLKLGPENVKRWANQVLEILLPPVCASCGKVGEIVCAACRASLPVVPEPFCLRCGRPHVTAVHGCDRCANEHTLIAQRRAPLYYAHPADTLIKRLKYDGYFALARPLAQVMIRRWPEWQHPIDYLVPVPLHPRRARARGFNQSALLAGFLGEATRIPVSPRAVRRVRHTRPQVELHPTERHHNVAGAFAADERLVSGKHILIVDDVLTTGATAASLADALTAAGALSVSAYCLAQADH